MYAAIVRLAARAWLVWLSPWLSGSPAMTCA